MNYEGWPDILRYVVMALYGTLLAQASRIVYLYYCAERIRGHKSSHRGLLTRHVVTIGVSYIILATECVYENIIRIGDAFSAYIPVNAFGFLFGIYALSEMLQFERRRLDLLTGEVDVEQS
jgi:hypothetical protein